MPKATRRYKTQMIMELFVLNNQKFYPIGWDWLEQIPLQDFLWLVEIFEDRDLDHLERASEKSIYDYLHIDYELDLVLAVNRIFLAEYLNLLGYKKGIKYYAIYLVAKSKGWTSEGEILTHYPEIKEIINHHE